MAVPTRPVTGAVVDTPWGQVVHDTIVAVDIQSGKATAAGGSGFVAVTWARPFANTSYVIVAVAEYMGTSWFFCNVAPSTVSGATIYVRDHAGAVPPGAVNIHWLAIGARA